MNAIKTLRPHGTMTRDEIFGRMLAFMEVAGELLLDADQPGIMERYMEEYQQNPGTTFKNIQGQLLMYSHRFTVPAAAMFTICGEMFRDLTPGDFSDEPLNDDYYDAYSQQIEAIKAIDPADFYKEIE